MIIPLINGASVAAVAAAIRVATTHSAPGRVGTKGQTGGVPSARIGFGEKVTCCEVMA